MQANTLAIMLRKPYSLHMIHTAAVLTGDLIASTQAGQGAVDGAMEVLEGIALHEAQISGLDIRFARFRGDGWQMYCPEAARVFRLTVLVLANLHSRPKLAQTRLAVATGEVTVLPATGLASASGEVFSKSGHALDSIRNQRLVYASLASDSHWHGALFSYLEWQSSRWSPEQAEAIAMVFHSDPPQFSTLAGELDISRQAAQSRLRGAGFSPLFDSYLAFKNIHWSTP